MKRRLSEATKPWIAAVDPERPRIQHVWFQPDEEGHDVNDARCFCDPVTEHLIGGGQIWMHRRNSA